MSAAIGTMRPSFWTIVAAWLSGILFLGTAVIAYLVYHSYPGGWLAAFCAASAVVGFITNMLYDSDFDMNDRYQEPPCPMWITYGAALALIVFIVTLIVLGVRWYFQI